MEHAQPPLREIPQALLDVDHAAVTRARAACESGSASAFTLKSRRRRSSSSEPGSVVGSAPGCA